MERNINIEYNDALTSLTGLNALTSVGSFFTISFNPALTSLSALNALTSVGLAFAQSLIITDNDALPNLSGLNALTSIGGSLNISGNDALTSVTALSALSSIGGQGFIVIDNNDALTSLTGLDNIDPATIKELYIVNSSVLSLCGVNSICSFLAIPANPTTFSLNAVGCNTRMQVEAACLALPIELVSFTGENIGNRTILSWHTISEQYDDYFLIEHSPDAILFEEIGMVEANGHTHELKSYSFIHKNPSTGVNYYRIKQVEFNGKYAYSNTISINIKGNEVNMFPNPTTGIIELQSENGVEGMIRLTDDVGRIIHT